MRRRTLLIKEKPYLEVTPAEVQWITMETPVTYRVNSNREWRIH